MRTQHLLFVKGIKGLIIILFLLFLFQSNLYSQTNMTFSQTIDNYFKLLNIYPKENIYLQLDKPYYSAGDNMFYRAYLVNNLTLMNDAKSNFIYVELLDKQDSLVFRQKIKRDSTGIFKGSYKFPLKFKKGDYVIRAYTSWMQNWSPDYFFSKQLSIGNSIANELTSTINYTKSDNGYNAHLQIYKDNKTFRKCNVVINEIQDGKIKLKKRLKTDDTGGIIFPVLPAVDNKSKSLLSVQLDDPDYEYTNSFVLPIFEKDFAVTFFPEGGRLLSGNPQVVAFKAQGNNGYSTELSGIILNSANDTVAEIKTKHDGMGSIGLFPISGEKFRAVVTNKDGITKTIELPNIDDNGVNITAISHDGKIYYKIIKGEKAILPDSLNLLIVASDKLLLNKCINSDNSFGMINEKDLPEGIIHFLLVTPNLQTPISERLIFVRHSRDYKLKAEADSISFSPRTKNCIKLTVEDKDNNPIVGDYSLSITDPDILKEDSLTENIYSSFLISSQLKGFIENPGYYFGEKSKELDGNTDLLMLTHGWRKYADFDFTKPYNLPISHYIEVGQTLSGRVKELFGKGKKGRDILAFSPKANIFSMTKTLDDGKFIIQGINFPDSTEFVVQAQSKSLLSTPEIIGDTYEYPLSTSKYPLKIDSEINSEYLNNTRNDYFNNGGMQVYNLKEVTIYGKKKTEEDDDDMTYGTPSSSIKGDDLTKFGGQTVYDVVSTLPGISASPSELTFRGSTNVKFVLDDVQMDVDESIIDYMRTIDLSDIETVNFYKGIDASMFMGGADAVIMAKSKRGHIIEAKRPINVTLMKPMGYTICAEFYNPVYDTPEKINSQNTDSRTTLYWNPAMTVNEDKSYNVEFYNNDITKKYHIVMEGICEGGIPYRFVKDFK